MSPAPLPGRVVHFGYLWRRQRDQGRVEAVKDRPCVVLLVDADTVPGRELVSVLPITHSPPKTPGTRSSCRRRRSAGSGSTRRARGSWSPSPTTSPSPATTCVRCRITITDAAKAAGVARSTIYDRVSAGELSRGPTGQIDTAELLRVFGELHAPPEPGENDDEGDAAAVAASTAWLHELADRQLDQIERLTATIDRQAAELREADMRAADERRGLLSRLDRMTLLLPPPASATAEPEPSRGWWRRLLG